MNLAMIGQVLLMVLPWKVRRIVLNKVFGYRIHPTARIGYSILIAESVEMHAYSRVGSLTLVKGLSSFILEEHAHIGPMNWLSGYPKSRKGAFWDYPEREPAFLVKRHGAVTLSHYIDCTDKVTIGAFALVAGRNTQILTHSVEFEANRQMAAPVTIGDYTFVGTRSILLRGTSLPSHSILGAGSVLTKQIEQPHSLIGGNPAKVVKELDASLAFFVRESGDVH